MFSILPWHDSDGKTEEAEKTDKTEKERDKAFELCSGRCSEHDEEKSKLKDYVQNA